MYLSLVMIWFSVWRVHILWPVLGRLQLSIVVEVALAMMVLLNYLSSAPPRLTRSKVLLAPFVLFGLMIVGLPFSLYPGRAFTFVTKDFGPTLLLLTGVATSIRTYRDLEWLTFAHLVGAVVYCTWVYVTIPIGPGGRLSDLVFYDANDFALIVAASIPFAVYFARPGVTLIRRLFSIYALLLFACMIIKSGSRGGFLGLIAVAIFIVTAMHAIPLHVRLGAVAAGACLFLIFAPATYWTQMRTLLHPSQDANSTEDIGRKAIWKRGVGYMLSHPALGVGASNFPQAEGTISELSREYAARGAGLKWSTAHNSFVLVGAELGVGGLLTYVTMFVASFVLLGRIREGGPRMSSVTPDDVAFARTLMGSLLAFVVSGSFVSATYFAYLYVTIGLATAHLSGIQYREANAGLQRARAPRRVNSVARAHFPLRRTPWWASIHPPTQAIGAPAILLPEAPSRRIA